LARRLERVDVDRFPRIIYGKSDEVEVVVTRSPDGAPLRSRLLQRGKCISRPLRNKQTPADLCALVGQAPFLQGYERNVGINITLAICQSL
jgi:hypothetical protein